MSVIRILKNVFELGDIIRPENGEDYYLVMSRGRLIGKNVILNRGTIFIEVVENARDADRVELTGNLSFNRKWKTSWTGRSSSSVPLEQS